MVDPKRCSPREAQSKTEQEQQGASRRRQVFPRCATTSLLLCSSLVGLPFFPVSYLGSLVVGCQQLITKPSVSSSHRIGTVVRRIPAASK